MFLRISIAALILPTNMQESRPALASVQHAYSVVYGVRTVTPTLSLEDAKARGLSYGQIPKVYVTRFFAVNPSSGERTLVFSDETLPVMVLNREGGGESSIYGIVVTNPSQRKAITLMGTRPRPGDRRGPTPSLHEVSLDGRNAARRIADVEDIMTFAVSPDGAQVAYFTYRPQRLVIRSTDSGKVTGEVPLDGSEIASVPRLSWSPDGNVVLVRRWPGPEHETEYDLVHVAEGRVERTGIRGEIYSFFPKSNRLLGVHLIYDRSTASPLRQFFSMALRGHETVNLPIPQCRECWHAEVSPDEKLMAYPYNHGIAVSALATRQESQAKRDFHVGHAEVLGWIVN